MANWFSFYILLNGHGGRVFLQDHDLTFWKYVPNDDTFGSYANLVFSLRGTPLLFSTGPIVLYMPIGNIPRTGYVVEYYLSWARPWVWYPAQPTSQPTNKPQNQTNKQPTKQTIRNCEAEFQCLLYIFNHRHSSRYEEIFYCMFIFPSLINNADHPYIEFWS